MGATKRSILIMFCALILFRHVEASSSSLDSFLYNHALNSIPKPRTGQLYEVSSPANFSGVGVSLLRLRAHSLWKNGASLGSIGIPPKAALPFPFTRRVDLVYQDLGNWSTSYYNIVPNYTLVAPVVGLQAYDSDMGPTSMVLVGLEMRGDSVITVSFQNVSLHQYDAASLRCVRFGADGTLQLSNVSGGGGTCVWRSDGHFSIVAPPLDMKKNKKGKESAVKWWMIGVPGGVAAAAVLIAGGAILCRWRSVRKMERNAERSEGLNSIWIGNSRMPTATGIRTQPTLENSYIP
ncbi:uncharacterized protein LOC125186026 [Salvia hispanica]|uniref:uncharacterized protein LOC125186026 n=1 Tax=Salvia hispanica TaxID=49212 RepID=UPI00200996BC|nr:uncharacterized protein LOC125186026 [Salvia hispanica]